MVNSLNNTGYNIFNENDSFYNDICATYTSENGTDMLLLDRKKDIYTVSQNQSLCQSGCEIQSYNSTTKKAKCDCSINTENITDLNVDELFDKKEIAQNFYNTLTNSNFHVLKCYKLIIDFSKISENIGEISMSLLFIIFIILIVIYCIKGRKTIHNQINYILELRNMNNKKSNNNKNNKNNKKEKINDKKKTKINTNKKQTIKRKTNKSVPPKKMKIISKNKRNKIKNKSISILKKSSERNLHEKNINNNILLNVQIIKPSKKSKTNIVNKNNSNKFYKGRNPKFINTTKKILYAGSNIKKKLRSIPNDKITERNLKTNKNKDNDNYFRNLNDQEMNSLEYEKAIKYDRRTYCQYYWSLLRKKQLILFTFLPANDYNIVSIKIALFITSFSLYFTINGFFFSDDTMHKVYEDKGAYNILYQIPQILYSSVISSLINIILKQLSLSEKNLIQLKGDKTITDINKKSKSVESCLKIKFILFFIISFILMLFFWYFISTFCAVYTNTQSILIKDTLISFITSMLYPYGLNLLPGIFRMPALRAKNKKCLYTISSLIALI